MKRSILLLILFSTILTATHAQAQSERKRVTLGVHADPLVTFLTADNPRIKGVGAKMGVNTGLDLEIRIADRYALTTGLSFDFRNSELRFNKVPYMISPKYDEQIEVPIGASVHSQAYYIQNPIALKMRAVQIGYLSLFAAVGFTWDILVYQTGYCPEVGLEKQPLRDYHKYVHVGYLARLGMEYSLGGPSSIEAGIGFNGSINPTISTSIGNARSQAVTLRLAFIF